MTDKPDYSDFLDDPELEELLVKARAAFDDLAKYFAIKAFLPRKYVLWRQVTNRTRLLSGTIKLMTWPGGSSSPKRARTMPWTSRRRGKGKNERLRVCPWE
jgi:hypothetical protein